MKSNIQKSIEFDESLFFYNEEENTWEEKSEIIILIQIHESLKSTFENSSQTILSLKSKNLVFKKQSLRITHDYEFHYFPKANFKSEKDLKTHPVLKSANIPNHLIAISVKKIEENGDVIKYYDFFGCNDILKNSRGKISTVLARLYYEARYSAPSIMHQVQERITMLIKKSFKDILKYLAKEKNISNAANSSISEFIEELLKKEIQKNKNTIEYDNFKKEVYNIVYKCVISEGIYPFYCEINTMNTSSIRLALSSLLIPDSILPWSPKFHASFSIGSFHYSFNRSNRMITKRMTDRNFYKDFFYVRIRILDFFPLDEWIESMANFFLDHLDSIINDIKLIIEWQEKEIEEFKSEIFNENEFENIDKGKEMSHTTLSQEIPKNMINEPLMGKNKTCIFTKIFKKKEAINEEDRYKKARIKLIKKRLKNLDFITQNNDVAELSALIAIQFYENYKFELVHTNILWSICKIIARTELRQYETLSNNCQTPVAESLHIIHERLKQFIEPLQEFKNKPDDNIFYKFSNNNKIIMKPVILDCNLDYFGIYADKYLQEYLINVKKVNIFENFKKVNDRISMFLKEKKIEKVFKSFEEICKNRDEGDFCYLDQINKVSSFFLFMCENNIFNIKNNLSLLKKNKEIDTEEYNDLKKKIHEIRILHKELSFNYFNSVRLKNSYKLNKNNISYIGFLIIKDPKNLLTELPENGKEIYASAYI